jgi:hypothetical protein
VPRLALSPFARSPVVLCGWSFQVFDHAPLDVVLAPTGRGATVTGATPGRSTHRALRHHWRRDEHRLWRRWGGRSVDGALRLHCRPPDPHGGVAREVEGTRPKRVNPQLGPADLDHGLMLRASALSRFGGLRASRLKSCPQGQLNYLQYSLSGPVPQPTGSLPSGLVSPGGVRGRQGLAPAGSCRCCFAARWGLTGAHPAGRAGWERDPSSAVASGVRGRARGGWRSGRGARSARPCRCRAARVGRDRIGGRRPARCLPAAGAGCCRRGRSG